MAVEIGQGNEISLIKISNGRKVDDLRSNNKVYKKWSYKLNVCIDVKGKSLVEGWVDGLKAFLRIVYSNQNH